MFRIHKHKWINVACDTGYERAWYDAMAKRCTVARTMVLARCACGATDTFWLDGTWTESQLGIDAQTVSDLMRLLNETGLSDD